MRGMFSRIILALIIMLLLVTAPTYAQRAITLEEIFPHVDSLYKAEAYKACLKLENDVIASIASRKDTLAAAMYSMLGDSYLSTGDQLRALIYYEREVGLRRILGQTKTEEFSNALYNLTRFYGEQGQYAKAKKAGDELLICDASLRGLESEEYVASLLFYLEVLERSGDYLKAKEVGEKGLKDISEKHAQYGVLLSAVADVYSSLGLYSKAEASFLSAYGMQTLREGENSLNAINTSINLSTLYRNQGRYPEAEELLSSTIAVLKDSKDEAAAENYATALNNMALVQQALSQYTEAEASLKKVEEFDRNKYGIHHPYYATTQSNIASVLFDQGRTEEAESRIKEALEILQDSSTNRFFYAVRLNKLGNIYRAKGEAAKAIPLYTEARSAFLKKAGETSDEYANSTFFLGQAYYMLNDQKAKSELEKALKYRTDLFGKNHPKYAEVTRKLAHYWWQQNNYMNAANFFDETFRNYFTQIDTYFPALSEDEKSAFYVGKLKATFDEFYSFGIAHSKTHPELLSKLYDYQLRTKAMILYASQRVRNSILQSGDEALINSFNQWLDQKEQLAKLYSLGIESPEVTLRKIDSLTKEANKHEKVLTKKSAFFTGTFKPNPITWKDVKRMLKPGEAAIEVIRFKEFSPDKGGAATGRIQYAFLIVTSKTNNHPELVLIDNARPQETLYLNFYRNSIQFSRDDTLSYHGYWGPLDQVLRGYKKIYLSPDGVYNQINVSTLKNPKTGKYLFDEYQIKIVTNTKDLVAVKTKSKRTGKTSLIGHPKYNNSSGSLRNKNAHRSISRGSGASFNRGLRSNLMRYLRSDNGIADLPGTKEEIEKIRALFGSDYQVETVTDTLASESYIKSLKDPEMIHIATHGFFLQDVDDEPVDGAPKYIENPLLHSGLIMAGAGDFLQQSETQSPDEDGILSAYEVMNLNLENTELVVLSACETGLGTVKNGEGVYGLQRAFQIAGAKNIVMSLWSVDDAATKELMINFYQELLKTKDKYQAFRTAQQRLMEHFKTPFYWGAFVMVGD